MFAIDRRGAIIGGISLLAVSCGPQGSSKATETAAPAPAPDLSPKLEALEKRAGGRLGAFVLDTETGLGSGWRAGERFAHCSSFKLSLAAMYLAWADRGDVDLSERLRWTEADMLQNSNFTREHVKDGLTIEELAHVTLVQSDNTAANVLLKRAGGPFMVTKFWRSLGDEVSRLDRFETALNVVPPGTELDTTTPQAMAGTLAKLVVGDALKPASRDKLRGWMEEVQTGASRLRAGFPKDWIAGDKTGTGVGMGGTADTYVDIAWAGPEGRKPLIVTAYYNPAKMSDEISDEAQAVLAEVGQIVAENLPKPTVAALSFRAVA